jgi:hypothetical protein
MKLMIHFLHANKMKKPLRALMIILGVTLSSRFNSVLSFSGMATRIQNAKTTAGLRTVASAKTTALRGKTSNEDTRRSVKNNGNNSTEKQKKSTVAIIGGGIAGLSCARHLQHSYDVTVVSANQSVSLHIFGCRSTENRFDIQTSFSRPITNFSFLVPTLSLQLSFTTRL